MRKSWIIVADAKSQVSIPKHIRTSFYNKWQAQDAAKALAESYDGQQEHIVLKVVDSLTNEVVATYENDIYLG